MDLLGSFTHLRNWRQTDGWEQRESGGGIHHLASVKAQLLPERSHRKQSQHLMVPRPQSTSHGSVQKTSVYPDEPNKNARKEILCDGYYYDVTDFIHRHPGGRVIEFYVSNGEDATLAIQQFHHRSSAKVRTMMKAFRRRPANEFDYAVSPEVRARRQTLTNDFTKLYKELEDEGLFEPSIPHVIYRITELVAFGLAGLYLLCMEGFYWKLLGHIIFSIYLGRVGWLQHEGGHHALTGKPKVDRFLQTVIFGLGNGLSASWWSSQHNRHHAMPQRLEHDVDLNTWPLLVFNTKTLKDTKKGDNIFIRNQAFLFSTLDPLLIIIYWKFYHPLVALYRGKPFEFFLMAVHFFGLMYVIGFPIYLVSGWLACAYMLGNFTLSHTHLPVAEEPTHWVEYAFGHTMDITGSWWCDWWMGYLNYQVEHHLFPTMPQFRNPLIQERVKAFAHKHGITFHCVSYWEALRKTHGNLAHVANELHHVKKT